ncbi:serine O-acetyltransferase [Roseomonas sp. NAR14]|uniref:Serine acetyltransferase n=1 Tax=Roseomonas acroporae TaxID=2937791 RepID=A0A9X2BVK5_9PROT|nr:serine O-acetyltransferase [Roseomonas acroporae]MCK8785126.1 serine O-acetyltransferase [Roseomonas acroporae]
MRQNQTVPEPCRHSVSPCREALFAELRGLAQRVAAAEDLLAPYLRRVLIGRACFEDALAHLLAGKLAGADMPEERLVRLVHEALTAERGIAAAAGRDLDAATDRNPAAPDRLTPFLHFKGFHALQWHRVNHWLWHRGRVDLAAHFQSRVSETFGVDIHPAARVGAGVFIDHGTAVVVGETSVIGDDVSILQGVTLGGTGKQAGDRHPKVREGVLIGAGAHILGNIEIGAGAKIGAGSVVLQDVPPFRTAVGVPARLVGLPHLPMSGLLMDHRLPDAPA